MRSETHFLNLEFCIKFPTMQSKPLDLAEADGKGVDFQISADQGRRIIGLKYVWTIEFKASLENFFKNKY